MKNGCIPFVLFLIKNISIPHSVQSKSFIEKSWLKSKKLRFFNMKFLTGQRNSEVPPVTRKRLPTVPQSSHFFQGVPPFQDRPPFPRSAPRSMKLGCTSETPKIKITLTWIVPCKEAASLLIPK